MGARGPAPKRDDERIRRNTPDVPTTTISVIGAVAPPELDIERPHQLVVDLYESLKDSAQSRYYEPSDWVYARLTMYALNEMLTATTDKGKKIPLGAVKLQVVNQMMSALLLTEGDRRRVRIEVERNQNSTDATVTSISDLFRQELTRRPGSPAGSS